MLEVIKGQVHLQGEYELKISLATLIKEDTNKLESSFNQETQEESIANLV